jgi:hypothetical protein
MQRCAYASTPSTLFEARAILIVMGARCFTVVASGALVCFAVASCAVSCSAFRAADDVQPAEAGKDDAEGQAESGADGSSALDASPADADADADAAPDAPPPPGSFIVFASATVTAGDLMGGVSMADARCNTAAHDAGFPPSTKFVAWLSTNLKSAAARLTGDGPWYVPQPNHLPGNLVAADRAQLLSGTLAGPISRNEHGDVVGQTVWTGTFADGGASSGARCNEWSSVDVGIIGTVGASDQMDSTWTSRLNLSCAGTYSVYCFQVP